jgi:hypothetical protein
MPRAPRRRVAHTTSTDSGRRSFLALANAMATLASTQANVSPQAQKNAAARRAHWAVMEFEGTAIHRREAAAVLPLAIGDAVGGRGWGYRNEK